jgi:hypothetical protein
LDDHIKKNEMVRAGAYRILVGIPEGKRPLGTQTLIKPPIILMKPGSV